MHTSYCYRLICLDRVCRFVAGLLTAFLDSLRLRECALIMHACVCVCVSVRLYVCVCVRVSVCVPCVCVSVCCVCTALLTCF